MQLTLDRFGRVVLPKGMRDRLGIEPGDALEAEENDETLILRPAREGDGLVRKDGLLIHSGVLQGSVTQALKGHRNARLAKLRVSR